MSLSDGAQAMVLADLQAARDEMYALVTPYWVWIPASFANQIKDAFAKLDAAIAALKAP
jgi:hypothetical protein